MKLLTWIVVALIPLGVILGCRHLAQHFDGENLGSWADWFAVSVSLYALLGVGVAIKLQRDELVIAKEDAKGAEASHKTNLKLNALAALTQSYVQAYVRDVATADADYEHCAFHAPGSLSMTVRGKLEKFTALLEQEYEERRNPADTISLSEQVIRQQCLHTKFRKVAVHIHRASQILDHRRHDRAVATESCNEINGAIKIAQEIHNSIPKTWTGDKQDVAERVFDGLMQDLKNVKIAIGRAKAGEVYEDAQEVLKKIEQSMEMNERRYFVNKTFDKDTIDPK